MNCIKLQIWGLFILFAQPAFASSTGMPWEAPLETILNSLKGPVALAVSTAAIVIFGFAISHGEGGGMMRKAFQICLGISIVAGATTLLSTVFSLGSGTLM